MFLAVLFGDVQCSRLTSLPLQDRVELLQHMHLAAASYEGYPLSSIESQGFTHWSVPVSHHLFGFEDSLKQVRMFEDVRRSEFVIGFAGTDGYKDWVNNVIRCSGQASILGLHNIPVHLGFFEEALKLYGAVKEEIRERGEKGFRLYFNGHSRGGPVAAFVMAMFAYEHPELAPLCHLYSFNSALGAGPEFVTEFNRRFPGRAFNVFDERDIVGSLGIWSAIPGEQLAIRDDASVLGHPHKIDSLMANYILSHLQQDLGIIDEERLLEILYNLRRDEDLRPASDTPRLPQLNPLQVALNISAYNAVSSTVKQFSEDLAVLFIDNSINGKQALHALLQCCADVGTKTFLSSMLAQQCMRQLDYTGMGVAEINRLDGTIGQAAGMAVEVAAQWIRGDGRTAGQSALWGSLSLLTSHCLDKRTSIGPSLDVCNKSTLMFQFYIDSYILNRLVGR